MAEETIGKRKMEDTVMDQQSIMERQNALYMEKFAVETTAADHNFFEKDPMETVTTYTEEIRKQGTMLYLLKEQMKEVKLLYDKLDSKWKERKDLERKKVEYWTKQEDHINSININECQFKTK